jgi:serine/threonine-protein kinase RsbW
MAKRETLVIQSDPDNIRQVDEWAERIAEEMGFSEDERDDIAISVTEAVNNAIIHGNKQDARKRVVIEFIKNEAVLTVLVHDEGGGFDVETVDDPTKPENLMKPWGRGVHILRTLMDEVHFTYTKKGFVVTLMKWRKIQ